MPVGSFLGDDDPNATPSPKLTGATTNTVAANPTTSPRTYGGYSGGGLGAGGQNSNNGMDQVALLETEKATAEELDDKFKNRRRMAWLAMIAILLATVAMMFFVPVEKIKALENVVTWFYMAMTTVIGAYMGATTMQYIKGK